MAGFEEAVGGFGGRVVEEDILAGFFSAAREDCCDCLADDEFAPGLGLLGIALLDMLDMELE